ncbi:MAG: hypothetical protein H7099_16880 [Gemmatimonadaceae bacterium]|nr:hypothetical protein [Gemmatimonadaceae bacterium]
MMNGPMDESNDAIRDHDLKDPSLDALLRRADRAPSPAALGDLQARILSAAAFPLAARRRAARASTTADTLAAWVRVALPLAAAAAIFAAVSLSSIESTTLADAELRESDPAALLSALESSDASGLARQVIMNDAASTVGLDSDAR